MRDSEKAVKRVVLSIGSVALFIQVLSIVLKLVGIGAVATWPWALVLLPVILFVGLSFILFIVFIFSAFRLNAMINKDEK